MLGEIRYGNVRLFQVIPCYVMLGQDRCAPKLKTGKFRFSLYVRLG